MCGTAPHACRRCGGELVEQPGDLFECVACGEWYPSDDHAETGEVAA